jgi:enoyl-CoA hydratase/carnithine racemase
VRKSLLTPFTNCRVANLSTTKEDVLLVDIDEDRAIATLTINRPNALNALNTEVVLQLKHAYATLQDDDRVRALVLTGSEKAFAAGADIKEMLGMDYHEMESHDRAKSLLQMGSLSCSKPIVAAINGFTFGGGNEVAMSCDILIAGENAKFGQPEINLGIMAGAGGTIRLTSAVGKSLSMQMNLTGDPIDANRALLAGLVSEVVPTAECLPRAQAVAARIAEKSLPAIRRVKDAVLSSFELSESDGIKYEHHRFISCWATADQKIGMEAFANKKKAKWVHR